MNLQKFETEMRRRYRAEKRCAIPMATAGSSRIEPDLVLSSTCSPAKISDIFRSLCPAKASILKAIGFGGLLSIPSFENLNDQLSLSLYQRFDFTTMSLHLDCGVDLYLRDPDVNLIFDIPFEGRPVNVSMDHSLETTIAFHSKLFSQTSTAALNLCFLEEVITKDYGVVMSDAEIDSFIIASVLYSMSYLLAPESHHNFPIHLIKNFIIDVMPNQINWAQFVLWTIGRAAVDARIQISSGAKNISLFGCTYLLQVFYLDNLNFGPSTPYHIVLPRASAYSYHLMSKLIERESSGNIELRAATDVCYTRGWRHHLELQKVGEHVSQDDFLTSVGLFYEANQIVESLAPQFNVLEASGLHADKQTCLDIETSYVRFKGNVNNNMHNLFRKAVVVVKDRIIKLYSHHMPQDVGCNPSKRISIGSSMQEHMKRTKSCDNSQSARILPYLEEVQHQRGEGSNIQSFVSEMNPLAQVGEWQSSFSVSEQTFPLKKLVTSHSTFQECPFDVSFKHEDIDFVVKARCYLWLANPCLPTDELNRTWIVFTRPTEICLSGHEVKSCLEAKGSFNIRIVDAIMALWNYMDEYLHKQDETKKRWWQFLPASFAEMVINNLDYLASDEIRACFIGQHISYNVEDCQQIIIPVRDTKHTWSCYFWDFQFKTITVFDHVLMHSPETKLRQKHHHILWKLHNALFACKHSFFCGWDIESGGWLDAYAIEIGQKAKDYNSGVYAVHYARAICGTKIILKLINEPTILEGRGEILYQILMCEENEGYKPPSLMEELNSARP